jgi:NADH-quinone oxidoreductase subunit G
VPVTTGIADYYLTNPIARASETMARCSQELVHGITKMAAE